MSVNGASGNSRPRHCAPPVSPAEHRDGPPLGMIGYVAAANSTRAYSDHRAALMHRLRQLIVPIGALTLSRVD